MVNEFPGRGHRVELRSPSRTCAAQLSGRAAETVGCATQPQWIDLMFAFLGLSSPAANGFTSPAVAAPQSRKQEGSERLARAVTGLAGIAALVIALAFPAAYLLSANNRLMGILEVRAQIYGDQVTETASQNPELWNAFFGGADADLAGLAIAAADDVRTAGHAPERRRVFAGNGHLLLDVVPPQPLAWPTVSWRTPVLQNGNRLGDVEITRSLWPDLLNTFAIAIGSFTLGVMLLIVLRVIPLRLMREALDRVAYLSAHDQLTGLPNRAVLADRLEMALSAARRGGVPVAMLCLDLDRFKEVNDTLGHAAGDALLRTVTARLHGCLRESDTLARVGGDEFAVIQHGVRLPHEVGALATRLIAATREPVMLDGQQIYVGLSIGIAISTPDISAAELAKQADVALYGAKADGRGRFCVFAPEMNAALHDRRAMENDLRGALQSGGLAVHYQPQIDLASGQIVGTEALMRWTRPGHGAVSPAVFIPVAEETGLIVSLGAWLLGEACREAQAWPVAWHVAVNVSPLQFRVEGFLDSIRGALAQSGLDPQRLELEITEGVLLNDTEDTLMILEQLRALGVRLALDDFGTGYASLGYLQKFRFDTVKIDRSFVRSLGVDHKAAAIVRAVVGLCDALGMSTIAEGVENKDQLAMLRAQGCREVQGFLYWAPMPAHALHRVIEQQCGASVLDASPENAMRSIPAPIPGAVYLGVVQAQRREQQRRPGKTPWVDAGQLQNPIEAKIDGVGMEFE
jgi:diguanylate cyclase (GGDEF)-like protein